MSLVCYHHYYCYYYYYQYIQFMQIESFSVTVKNRWNALCGHSALV